MNKRRFKYKHPHWLSDDRQCHEFEYHPGDPITERPERLESHTVDASPCTGGYSGMLYQNSPTIYRPLDHEKLEVIYGGNPCSYDLDDSHHYCDFGGRDLDGVFTTYVPVRKMADIAATFFPAINIAPEVPSRLWDHRYEGDLNKIRVEKPSLNTGFSLANFILQWKDAKQVYNKYLVRSGRYKETKRILKSLGKNPVSAVRELANQRLEYMYGTKQFVQDVITIVRTMYTWKSYADKLARLANTPRYISKPLGGDGIPWLVAAATVPYRPFGLSDGTGGQVNNMFYIETWSFQSHMSCVYEYSCGEMRGVLSRAGQMLDALGVAPDLSIVWDAIPFSFVVDWFFNVGEWLHRSRRDWTQMRVLFAEYGTSAKFVNTRYVGYNWYGGADGFDNSVHTGMVISKTYTRYVRDLAVLPDRDRPTLNNPEHWSVPRILNATALAVQQVLKRGGVERHERAVRSFYRSWYFRPYNRFFGSPIDPVH